MRIARPHNTAVSTIPPSAGLVVGSRWSELGGAGRGAYTRKTGTNTGPHIKKAAMSDKSPRQTMTKKSGKSLKEKRAAKNAKAAHISQTEALLHTKKR